MSRPTRIQRTDQFASRIDRRDDTGAVLMFVLVTVLICSLIAIPMLGYIMSVFRAGEVQVNRAQAIEFANGGTWVALSNQDDLYEQCDGGLLTSSLDGVETTCDVIDFDTLRPPTEMPYYVSTVQATKTVPAPFDTADTYANPNTVGNAGAWLATPDWTKDSTFGKVWLPELPVRSTSSSTDRITSMPPGTQDPNFSSCRVFFPGTFTTPITIAEPAYFTSGVYYFTEPIVLQDGADVVFGNGSEIGCTTDFEAIALAAAVPDPLNMSGLGGTIVLGERGRITVDDSGTGNVRFAINQRYVSALETSVVASSDVAIISVNGDHEPFVGAPNLGADLALDVLNVPASRVGTEGSPIATDSNYRPSVLTPKPTEPDAPTNVVGETLQATGGSSTRGLVKVTWDVPNANGSIITSYTATDTNGLSCTTTAPPATTVRPSCTISGYQHNQYPQISVVAGNVIGSSPASTAITPSRVRFTNSGTVPTVSAPANPSSPLLTPHSDGLLASWTPPATTGRMLTTGYRITATPTVTVLAIPPLVVNTTVLGTPVSCEARWDETSCLLSLPTPAPLLTTYNIQMRTLNVEGSPSVETPSSGATMAPLYVWSPGSTPAPTNQPATVSARVPDAIVDFTTTTSTAMNVKIDGYVAVPQGRVAIAAADPATSLVRLTGGVVAAELVVEAATAPADLVITFDNPVAQKQLRITSIYKGKGKATSEAIVQLNRSGSLAVNSWVVQGGDLPPAPIPTTTTIDPASTTTTTIDPAVTTTTDPTTTTTESTTTTSTTTTTTTTTTVPDTTTTTTLPVCGSADSTWYGQYHDGKSLSDYKGWRNDESPNFDWGDGSPSTSLLGNDTFSIRWTKSQNFDGPGTYRFTVGSDDGVRLFVDGVRVINNWNNQGYNGSTRTADVVITDPCNVDLVMEYYEDGGKARVSYSVVKL